MISMINIDNIQYITNILENYYNNKINVIQLNTTLDKVFNKTIIRTNFFDYGKKYKLNSFCNWIIGSIEKGEKIKLVDDVYFNPISIKSLNEYIHMILQKPLNGTFNLGSKYGISKYNFGIKLISKYDWISKY